MEKGEHIFAIYPDQSTKIYDLISFIKTGIEKNELVFIMIDSLTKEEIHIIIETESDFTIKSKEITDRNNSIIITTTKEWFYPNGSFNTKRILNEWEKIFQKAKEENKEGLRCFIDVSSFFIEGLENGLVAYDKMLEEEFEYPFISVYAYKIDDIRKMTRQQLAMLYLNHGMIWVNNQSMAEISIIDLI